MSSSASAAWEASHSFFIFPQFVSSRRVGLVLLQWAVDCVGGGGCRGPAAHWSTWARDVYSRKTCERAGR